MAGIGDKITLKLERESLNAISDLGERIEALNTLLKKELGRRGDMDLRHAGTPNASPCGECGYLHPLNLYVGDEKWGCCLLGNEPRLRREEGVVTDCKHFGCS